MTEKIIEAQRLSVNCPVAQLPLELVFANWCDNHQPKEDPIVPLKAVLQDDGGGDTFELIKEKWPEIVAATKPYNHSLMAVLKAGKPKKISANYLIINVLYKFHKEKLEEAKNRDTLEKVISDIIKTPIKVKFELVEKKGVNDDGNV